MVKHLLAAAVIAVLTIAQAAADPYTMKIGLPTINESQHEFAKRFAAAVEQDSKGRIKAEIYPAGQLGAIPREIESVQFGAIEMFIAPPEFLVGVDARYEVASAPGLVADMAHGERIAEDATVRKMMLALGADKGLRGVAFFASQPASVIARAPIRHLSDFKGRKLRVLASEMQEEPIRRLGATPVALPLGDVLAGLEEGAVDGALSAMTIYTTMQYAGAAKYVTESKGLNFLFSIAVVSRKWYDALPQDLRTVIDEDAARTAATIDPWEAKFYATQRQAWTAKGGVLIALPDREQASLMQTLADVGSEIAQKHVAIKADYDTFAAVARKTR